MIFVFSAIFLIIMAAANFYIYRRFLKVLTPPISYFASIIPATLMIGEIAFIVEAATHIFIESPTLYAILSSFIGITFLLLVISLVYDLTISVSKKVPFDQERRRFIKVIFDVTMLIAAASYLLRGLSQGIKFPYLNNINVTIKDFPFDNYSIVQLTDIHVGRTIKHAFVKQLVSRANELSPDLVVITGDLVDLPIDYIKHDLAPLKSLEAPTYFILGNHEYFHDPIPILEHLKTLGIHLLMNESVLIGEEKGGFDLVGINDLTGERMEFMPPDYDKAFKNTKPERPCVVLAHQPKTIEILENRRCDLMLSGHTHGGQIFPFGFLVMMAQPYLAGLHQHSSDKQIFVSRGAGYWGPPLRVLAPSEISQIIINPAS